MGVHWALNASEAFDDQVAILDLRTLWPLDENMIIEKVNHYHRCLVVTEEPKHNTFAQSLAGRIQNACFENLDAPVMTIGSENMPAIPLNETLEKTMIPSKEKVEQMIGKLLKW
jgi:2-oxoisovalerate dehydrogenase E1 component